MTLDKNKHMVSDRELYAAIENILYRPQLCTKKN